MKEVRKTVWCLSSLHLSTHFFLTLLIQSQHFYGNICPSHCCIMTNHEWLHIQARRALGDFGVPIAIITMVTLDYLVPETYTEKLQVPEGLSPSNPTVRGWIISPDVTHIWIIFAAAAPALLVYILLFMETHICEWVFNIMKLFLEIHFLSQFMVINTLKYVTAGVHPSFL